MRLCINEDSLTDENLNASMYSTSRHGPAANARLRKASKRERENMPPVAGLVPSHAPPLFRELKSPSRETHWYSSLETTVVEVCATASICLVSRRDGRFAPSRPPSRSSPDALDRAQEVSLAFK